MYKTFGIPDNVIDLAKQAENQALSEFNSKYKEIIEHNQAKVLKAFVANSVSPQHLLPSYGYGYGDTARDVVDKVFADVFGMENALVRPNFINGTHTIKTALWSVLRSGDTLLSITGTPYDTLKDAIHSKNQGSLSDFGIEYKEVQLKNGVLDEQEILNTIEKIKPKAVFIQKSKGYQNRKALATSQINEMINKIKNVHNSIVMVDNCYGEFCEKEEPKADLLAGSLIKNPGGTIAKTGGYIAGKAEYVSLACNHLTSFGIGKEAGGNLGIAESILQGLWFAPIVVGEAIKTALFAENLYNLPREEMYDIVKQIPLNSPEKLMNFCQAIQSLSPIGSNQRPVPWEMPGYDAKVIMASGAFVEGCSLEISADGKFVEPYTAYLQGGSSFDYAKYAVALAFSKTM